MGIKGLNAILRKHNIPKISHLSEFSFKKVPFDISSYIYKFMATYGKETSKWIQCFLNLIILAKKYRVHLVPVFDGVAPVEKNKEKQRRREYRDNVDGKYCSILFDLDDYKKTGIPSKLLLDTMAYINQKKSTMPPVKRLLHPTSENSNSSTKSISVQSNDNTKIDIEQIQNYMDSLDRQVINIDVSDINKIKRLLTQFGVPYFDSPTEAETLCCYLVNKGLADVVMSCDSDCIPYSVSSYISKLDTYTGQCEVITQQDILQKLELDTTDQLTDFCILCKCDYNEGIFKVGPVKALNYIKTYKTLDALEKECNFDLSCLNYNRCREIFKCIDLQDIINKSTDKDKYAYVSPWQVSIDFDKTFDFCRSNELWIDREKIINHWSYTNIKFQSDEED